MDLEEKFYENLQAHQSVDSGNRIIIFLFKTYTYHFFLLFEFSNSLHISMWMYLWPPVLRCKGLLWKEKSDVYFTAISVKYYNTVSISLNGQSYFYCSEWAWNERATQMSSTKITIFRGSTTFRTKRREM